jgi:hypothetical protein
MKLFHGTSTKYLRRILECGLTPRIENGNDNWKDNPKVEPSKPFFIYLTKFWGYGLFYGDSACGENEDEFPVIIEVDVDEKKLLCDEDTIKVGRQHVKGFNTDAEGSLHLLGNVAYDGSIPKEQFVRIYIILDKFYSLNFEKDGFNVYATFIEEGKRQQQKDADNWLLNEMIKRGGILVYVKPFDVEFARITDKQGTLNRELGNKYRFMAYPELFNIDGTTKGDDESGRK